MNPFGQTTTITNSRLASLSLAGIIAVVAVVVNVVVVVRHLWSGAPN